LAPPFFCPPIPIKLHSMDSLVCKFSILFK
jgi:hypothetical protein